MAASLGEPNRLVAFLARDDDRRVLGFVAALPRSDYVNGCSTPPVGFFEELYVRETAQRHGVARGLVTAVEQRAQERGCTELTSDALLENAISQKAHRQIGFREIERVVSFRKSPDVPEVH